jgi:hypothetical protein
MPKKIEILEMILHTLNGGDSVTDGESKYHPAMVTEVIGEVYESLIAANVSNMIGGKGQDNFALDNYTKTFTDVPVVFSESREEYYSLLPAGVLGLPQQRGIRMISPTLNQSRQFAPRSNNSSVVYDELEVSWADLTPKYYLEGNKVFYYFPEQVYEKVLMKLCVSFPDLDDMDEIEMPVIMSKSGLLTLHDLVVRRFLSMPPEDTSNDNNLEQI